MTIKICIGSSCHLKGSHAVVSRLQTLVEEKNLGDQITLASKFCMGKCAEGVCVSIDEENFEHINASNVDNFFETEVLTRL